MKMNKPEQITIQQRGLKENLGKLLIKLLQLAAMKSKAVEENARIHIQDLINSKSTVEDFASRIGALLNTNFNKSVFDSLKSGLPLLRLALFRRELSIEGINPPVSLTWGLTVQKPTTMTPQVKRQQMPTLQGLQVSQPQATTAKIIYIPPKIKLEQNDEEMQTQTHMPLMTPVVIPTATLPFPKLTLETVIAAKKLKLEPTMDITYDHFSSSTKHSSSSSSSSLIKSTINETNEDSNDVLAMCGINMEHELHLAAESGAEAFASRTSPLETSFLHLPALKARFRAVMPTCGLDDFAVGVAELISSACKERLKYIVEKLVVITEHRTDSLKSDSRYEICKNVRGQLKFLEDIDKAEQKRHKEMEREILMRASKLKTKSDNPEIVRMRAKAKEMQRTEMEEMRQRDADMTALYAIGPRKKAKMECETVGKCGGEDNAAASAVSGFTPPISQNNNRPKRINLQDILFFMEQDPQMCRSQLLYEAYLK